jgi:hypothetical protein
MASVWLPRVLLVGHFFTEPGSIEESAERAPTDTHQHAWDSEMKIRIKGNSLRLRLMRSEVARFLAGDCLEETIHFTKETSGKFTYTLQRDSAVNQPTVEYIGSRVAILVPVDQANTWSVSDQVGIAESVSLGEFGVLALLIEKDFACLDRSGEDNEDTFANPNTGERC